MFSKKILSLDIGSKNIKIVTAKQRKNKVYIESTSMTPTPLHCIEDGNITDKNRLIEAIENILGMNNIKVEDTYCTTNSTDIINREMIVPKADEEDELDTIISFEIQQYLPIILDDYILQYNILEEIKNEVLENSLDKLKIMVVAYPKGMAEKYLNLIEELDLKAKALDLNFNSINKLVRMDVEINGEIHIVGERYGSININGHNIEPANKGFIGNRVAFIDMGAESISVNIYSKGKIEFTRIIASGGNTLDRAIAAKYDINLEEAEKRKKQYCDLIEENKAEGLEEFNKLIKNIIDNWISEIGRILHFYRNKKLGNNVDKVYLYGGTSRLKGIEKYMGDSLNTPLCKLYSMGNIVFGSEANSDDLDYYLNAIGAIIRL